MNDILEINRLKDTVESIIHSYSSIFFSQNKVLGITLLLMSFLNPSAGLYGLFSATFVNCIGCILHLDEYKIKTGYYGFNAVLAGIAIGVCFQISTFSLFVLFASSLLIIQLCIMAEGILQKYYLPILSVPFLITLWGVILSSQQTDDPTGFGIIVSNNTISFLSNLEIHLPVVVEEYCRSLSYVVFQNNILTGILISIALLIYSRSAFLYGAINYAFAYLVYYQIEGESFNLPFYQYGFNFIFTGIAVGCYYVIPSVKSLIWTLLLVPVQFLLIFASSRLLTYFFLPTYSLAFCVTSILYLYMLKSHINKRNPEVSLYIETTPEKNIYNNYVNKQRLKSWSYKAIQLPFMGQWKVSQGHNGSYTHKGEWKHAWDFNITDDKDKQFEGNGFTLTDYYCYGKPVTAPATGTIVAYENTINDNEPGADNLQQNWGNYVIIKHDELLYSVICHLKKGSIHCNIGQTVEAGERIALCGNSGHSPYPHLHFQLQKSPLIGAQTLFYPLAQYQTMGNEASHIITSGIPAENDYVCNIANDETLSYAYRLKKYKTIKVSTDEEVEEWELKTDAYLSYLEDKKGNKAWYTYEGDLFYFVRYEGEKMSLLHHFFLSNYKVSLSSRENWSIVEEISLTSKKYDWRMFIQDCFGLFCIKYHIKYNMKLVQKECKQDNQYTLESKIESYFFDNKCDEICYKTLILGSDLCTIEIREKGKPEQKIRIEGIHY